MTDIGHELRKLIDQVDDRDWQNIFPQERDEIVAAILQRFDVTPREYTEGEKEQARERIKYVTLEELADIVDASARYYAGGYPDTSLLKLVEGLRRAT